MAERGVGASTEGDEVLFEVRGRAGVVVLNRPKALNALTPGMVRALAERLAAWAADPAVALVVVRGAGERAFCAGGDVRALRERALDGEFEAARAFWREEYALNRLIKRYPKPYVALIDGIVMGGGVGLSLHGSHRVAGPRTLLAMPEVGIGFFPDVGATHALPRLPGRAGAYLALTGARVGPEDALALGLATHRRDEGAEALVDALAGGDAAAALGPPTPPGPAPLDPHRALIDCCFGAGTVEGVLAALDREAAGEGEGAAFAAGATAALRAASPTSLRVAHEQVRRGAVLTFEEAMALEFRVVSRIGRSADFLEGVRAALVDRDGAPRWSPPDLAGVGEAAVAAHFAPLPDELTFPDAPAPR